MKIAVIGTGVWGKGFGQALQRNGHEVTWVSRQEKKLPDENFELIFVALPCQALRGRLQELQLGSGVPIISLIKGIEINTGLRVTQIIQDVFPGCPVGAVSGPGLAHEVGAGLPTVLVVAASTNDLTALVQKTIHSKKLRTYRSNDLPGVEYGGALKNIFAIASGVCTGLKMGENAMAGLTTRALPEMVRVAVAGGSKMETLFGLSGLGDLMLTAYSTASRNHRVGEALAHGGSLKEILEKLGGVAEGVFTTEAVYKFTLEKNIKAPIVEQTYQVLFQGKKPLDAMNDLLTRDAYEE